MADEHRRLEENRCTKIRQRFCSSLSVRRNDSPTEKEIQSIGKRSARGEEGRKIERGEGNTNALTRKLRHNGYLPLHLTRCSVLSIGCTGIGRFAPEDEFLSTGSWPTIHRWKMRSSTNNYRARLIHANEVWSTSWFVGYSPWDSSCAYLRLSGTYRHPSRQEINLLSVW